MISKFMKQGQSQKIPYSGFSLIGDCVILNSRRCNNSAYPRRQKGGVTKGGATFAAHRPRKGLVAASLRYLARDAPTRTLEEKSEIHPNPCQTRRICRDVTVSEGTLGSSSTNRGKCAAVYRRRKNCSADDSHFTSLPFSFTDPTFPHRRIETGGTERNSMSRTSWPGTVVKSSATSGGVKPGNVKFSNTTERMSER